MGQRQVESGMQSGLGSSEPLMPPLCFGLIGRGCVDAEREQQIFTRRGQMAKLTSSFLRFPYKASSDEYRG